MALTIIFGAGGHARVVLDSMLTALPCSSLVILDNDRRVWGTELFGVPIRGDDSCLTELLAEGARRFVIAVGSNGPAHLRQALFQTALDHGLEPHTVIHPRAIGSARMQVDAGAQLLAGCVVNAAAHVQANVIVNSGCIVEHDCVLEPHAHIAPGAKLCGAVRVGSRAHVGAGAVVRQGITIGADAVVGAGAVVVKDVPPHSVVVGVPARILRKAVA